MRIVADTNILISSIFWDGAPYRIVQQALDEKITVITSSAILNEVRKVLRDPKERFVLSEQEIDDVIVGIRVYATAIEPTKDVVLVRDAKDNHVIACALTAHADVIVTRDNDLLVLKNHKGVSILTPEDFLQQQNPPKR